LKEAEGYLQTCPSPLSGMSAKDMRKTHSYAKDSNFQKIVENSIRAQGEVDSLRATIKSLQSCSAKRIHAKMNSESYHFEADVSVASEGPISTMVRHGNVEDSGGTDVETTIIGLKENTQVLRHTMLNMDDFFSRPVQLGAFTLATATTLATSFDVWNLYFAEPAVRAKLRNYGFIRANLKVRANVSGTPFHSGRLLFSFIPFSSLVDAFQALVTVGASQSNFITYLSQVPGCQIVDVRRNTPVEMVIPYVSPQPMIRLFNKSTAATPSGTAYNDLIEMGLLYVYSINQIASVSASPSPISVYIYGWLEDVELGCVTGTQTVITTESDDWISEADERQSGPVQRIASRASEIANSLTSVPYIGAYAKASSMMLGGLSSLASLFGWSVPNVETQPMRMKNDPFYNAAHVIGYDTGKRITLDPKQELTVDPRVVAVEEDEMAISFVAGVESYLTTFTWNKTTAPLSGPMWESVVSPIVAVQDSGSNYIQPTALAFSALPFIYWRGDISFRFEVVCSNFHRGKFAIYYEPNVSQEVLIDANLALNKQFVEIIDIQETTDVEICVNWAFPRHWCAVLGTNSRSVMVGSCGSTISAPLNWFETANGYIGITPITELQSPDDSSVSINVYVKSDNIQYNQLADTNLPTSRTLSESDDWIAESEVVSNGVHNSTTHDLTCFVINPTGASTKGISELHFGEVPVSFRNLIKRFTTTYSATISTTGVLGKLYMGATILPSALPSFSTNVTYDQSLIGYLQFAYLGMRGGIRKRWRYATADSQGFGNHTKITLAGPGTSFSNNSSFTASTFNNYSSLNGTVSFISHTNGGIEYEIPFYNNNLFAWACTTNPYDAIAPMQNNVTQGYNLVYETSIATTGVMYEESAAAEDFSLLRWIAAPAFVV